MHTQTPRGFALVGPGRAGSAVAVALVGRGWHAVAVAGRSAGAASTRTLAGRLGAEPRDVAGVGRGADLVVVATPDAAIADAAAALVPGVEPGALVVHLSGACDLDELDKLRLERPDLELGSLHPLQSLPDADLGARRLAGSWCAVDGPPSVERLAVSLGMRPFRVAPGQRAAYHAAATVASNHLVALVGQAVRVAATAGIPPDALWPLLRSTLENVEALGPEAALTGPVARGDVDTVARHLRALDPDERAAYAALARAALVLTGRDDPALLAALEREVDRVNTITTVAELRVWCDDARARGQRVGFVPTMGFFHAGHRSLMRAARTTNDVVVVSLFVNPTQFGAGEDLTRYPRDPDGDAAVARAEGVDVLFTPGVAEMYPEGARTTVHVDGLTVGLCGASRPGHFDGVTTVVTKLFSMVGPCRAYFGRKDAQQLAVIRRMATDLDLPVEVVGCPLVREGDGLAMSSRNAYLSAEERTHATVLSRALRHAGDAAVDGVRDAAQLRTLVVDSIADVPGVRLDYAEVVDAETLEPVVVIERGALVAVAAYVGTTRLIDNVGLEVDGDSVSVDAGVLSGPSEGSSRAVSEGEVPVA